MNRRERLLLVCAMAGGAMAGGAMAGCGTLDARRVDDLKVTRAVLYQNGVGYFERHGKVDGDVIKLRVLPQQIADVLKSLTVVDLGSGRAVNVALPVEKTQVRQLEALPRQVRHGGGLLAIARAFRGARASVEAADGWGSGRIVGVEHLSEEGGWRLTILGDDGTLKSFDVAKVRALQIQDRTLEVGLRKALDVALDQGSWKPVELTVHLAGASSHDLLVSYVVEMPTWKPAYRVVLTKGEPQALLQGWAVVDNVSGEDWNRVALTLTAGTPLTFTYDLYRPRYVRRPDLSPQQEAMGIAPPPPTDGAGAVAEAEESLDADEAPKGAAREEDRTRDYKAKPKKRRSSRGPHRPRPSSKAEAYAQPAAPPPPQAEPAPQLTSELLRKGFSALVKGSRVGSLFRYDIDAPVTIKDRQSALVSILNQKVPAEDVLLFRMDTSATNPYRAVRLNNTTGYVIEQGPVAIYRDGSFVGEAVGGQVEAGTSAFVPYALDGRVIVALEDSVKDEAARLLRIVNGQLVAELKHVALYKYTIHNRTGGPATLYVQRAHRPGWKLVAPAEGVLIEKSNYFAPVKLAAKGKTELEVREETPVRRTISVFSHEGRQVIALYLKDPSADPKVVGPLKEALELQEKVARLEEELARLKREKEAYSDRQEQVRDNLKLLRKSVRNADLARKLTATLLELETKLNDVTRKIVTRDMEASELRDRLTVLLKSVTLERK